MSRGESGQSLPAILGLGLVVVIAALGCVAILGASTAKGRAQRAVDLAALSAARSMRDDYHRLFIPRVRRNGSIDPNHLSREDYLDRAEEAARTAARKNGAAEESRVKVGFPEADPLAPREVEVELRALIELPEGARRDAVGTDVIATAEIAQAPTSYGAAGPATASGGGYSGPLAYRQGKPMRPDVAAEFDRMAAAARGAGFGLVVNSAFRSDAEQAALFAANPDPRWVARPGTSLHRCGTELDLGPPAAQAWLAANAGRFGFLKRYSWEPWHFGFTAGPAPCSAEADRAGGASAGGSRGVGGGGRGGDGGASAGGGLPGYVPSQFRGPLLDSASRHDVPAELLAAQLMAESNFNPAAVSPVGASGIAQFMPATAAAYGLRDPFDPVASIDAQARMMSELLAQFGSVELALAAYNAGPGAVAGCNCIPPYPETRNYVAKITGLISGSGALGVLAGPSFEIRLIS